MESNQDQQSPKSHRFDLIILGASGFTGKYVVKEALKFLNNPSSPLKSIALAGRNVTKLTQTLQWASQPNPPPSLPILTADTTDPASLRALCNQTSLILNCVGPFLLYGEPVVAATIWIYAESRNSWREWRPIIMTGLWKPVRLWFRLVGSIRFLPSLGSCSIHGSG
ncbi:putative NAD(P)-binding domain-containing protein [Lupinus albus]|uniref:Putative NAD(P)-binding domain-containing protein n=1 Tax=Lupinus albus TaxID=3870 RepID=A0A6A4P7L5_LUPAL|nr:putative NAD(P)-binding domain-containing protein [Lupinus albus]